MRTEKATNLIALLGVLAALLTSWIAFRATYDISDRGPAPPKRLEANYFGASDPLADLREAESALKISVTHDNKEIENLRIVQATLQNTGKAPIVPTDMVEPLSVSVQAPWRILNVVNSNITDLKLRWRRVDDSHFVSDNTLINPQDMVWVSVYLAADGRDQRRDKPKVEWKARIINLKSIEQAPQPGSNFNIGNMPFIILTFPAALFTIASFIIYFTLTVLLMERLGFLRQQNPKRLWWLLGGAGLNLAASEAGATYVFGFGIMSQALPISHLSNAPPVLANAILIALLLVAAIKRERAG